MSMYSPSTVNVLLVEDNADKLNSLKFILTCAGYTTVVATREEAAVACASRERIHLVLIGEDFVAKHGFVLCAWLRRLFPLPIVILAPLRHPDDLTTALRLGADDYIIKPIPHSLLLARLAAVLKRNHKRKPQHRCKSCLPA